ncbi:MAG: hypothetical protein ABEI52_01250 [Halobacteriaceae archaeon]
MTLHGEADAETRAGETVRVMVPVEGVAEIRSFLAARRIKPPQRSESMKSSAADDTAATGHAFSDRIRCLWSS